MTKFFTVLSFFLILTLFTACSSTSDNVKPNVTSNNVSLPRWYTQPDKEDKRYIYGLGQGKSRKAAISSALDDAVSTLHISVSSSFERQTHSNIRNDVEEIDMQNQESIKVVTGELALNNYEVIEHKQLSNGTDIAMIRIDKHKLFQSLYDDLDNTFKMLDTALQNKSDTLEMLMIYRKYIGMMRQHMTTLGILHTLNPAFDATPFKTAYRAVINAHNRLLEGKRFKLTIDDPYGAYAPTIRKLLMRDGLTLTTGETYDYIIRVGIKEKSEVAVRRQVIIFLTTTFSVGVGNKNSGKDIYFTTFKLKSESDDSIEKAREMIVDALENKIEHHDTFKLSNL